MESLSLKHQNKAKQKNLFAFLPYAIIVVLLWFVFYQVNIFLFRQGYADELLLYFGEKSLLAHHGAQPRIENIIFIDPFIPYFVTLIFNNPFIAIALQSAVAFTILFYLVIELRQMKQISSLTAIMITLYLLLTPAFLFLFTQNFYFNTAFWLLFLCGYLLRRYYFERMSSHLLLFGICLALFISNTMVGNWSFIILLPAIIVITYSQKRPYIAILIVVLFPTLFTYLASFSFNAFYHQKFCLICPKRWPLALTASNQLLEAQVGVFIPPNFSLLASSGKIIQTFAHFGFDLANFAILMLPFWIFFLRSFRYASLACFLTIACIPLLWTFIRIYLGFYTPSTTEHLIYILYSILFFSKFFGPRLEFKRSITAIVCLFFILSAGANVYLTWNSQFLSEKNFFHALLGKPFIKNLEGPKAILAALKQNGKILLDDEYHYKIVFLSQDPNRFILPYQDQFPMALSNPQAYVEYVIVSKNSGYDQISNQFPDSMTGYLKGYHFLKEYADTIVYERNSSLDHIDLDLPQQNQPTQP